MEDGKQQGHRRQPMFLTVGKGGHDYNKLKNLASFSMAPTFDRRQAHDALGALAIINSQSSFNAMRSFHFYFEFKLKKSK